MENNSKETKKLEFSMVLAYKDPTSKGVFMRILVLLFLPLILLLACTKTQKKITINPLPIKRLIESPSLNGQLPRAVKISPDGQRLTFLKAKENDFQVLDLWEFDIKTGEQKLLVDSKQLTGDKEENISQAEQARRERMRIMSTGIIQYYWSKQGDKLLFPLSGDLYVYEVTTGKVVQITKTKEGELDPRFSPLGNFVSFVRNNNVFIYDLKAQQEKQVSFAGTKDKPMGVAEFIAQEEMHRFTGYWWSPDENFIASTHVDLTTVEEVKRFEIYADKVEVIEQRYPSTGTPNAIVNLKVFELAKAGIKQKALDIPISTKDYYIPQAKWNKNKKNPQFSYSIQTRDQKNIDLYLYNPKSKTNKLLLSEKDPAWVNIRHDFKFLKDQNTLLWISEKDGFSHIYKINTENGSWTTLTKGPWVVSHLEAINYKNNEVYFTAKKESPLETHLYKVSYETPQEPVKITSKEGSHGVSMVDDSEFYLDYFSDEKTPTSLASYSIDGKFKFFIEENKIDENHPLSPYYSSFGNWEYAKFSRKALPDLYYKVLKPKNFNPNKKYPVIQYVYGGPGVQLVTKNWGRSYLYQILAQKGFVIIIGDNRGTPNRGRDFERSYHNKFGQIEVEDQSAILDHFLNKNSYADRNRIGVFGHSYGGYLSLMLLMQKPELYNVAVSGAPVVDWKLYDTHYTERYIGKPQDNKEVYKLSNVLSYTDNLKGKLLVAHGMADDNVLYSNSLQLYSDLQEKGKMFDVQAYPGAKHGIRRKKSWQHHYQLSIVNYFVNNLR